MNARELAEKLGKHPNTIYKDIKNGKIPATKVGKSYEVDDRIAHNMIVKAIYSNSSERTNQIIDTLLEELHEEKRRAFREFSNYIFPIVFELEMAIDKLEDYELENMCDNEDVIKATNLAIERFEKKSKEFDFEKKARNITDMLQEYTKVVDAIKVIEENRIFAEYGENRKSQFGKYDEVKRKLGKEELTIQDINENIEI